MENGLKRSTTRAGERSTSQKEEKISKRWYCKNWRGWGRWKNLSTFVFWSFVRAWVFGYDKKDSVYIILHFPLFYIIKQKKQPVSYNSALIKYNINFALTLIITSLLFPLTLIYIITLWDKQSTETLGLVKKRNVDYFVLKEKRVFYLI